MAHQPNLGWLFYKDYYQRDINFEDKTHEDNAEVFAIPNQQLFGSKWDPESLEACVQSDQSIRFTTTYPGLLIGSGYRHETGCKGEMRIGFFFDHTTGMPMIPGSSVKGTLRSAFRHPAYIQYMIKDYFDIALKEEEILQLEEEIFTGDIYANMYAHDVFFDAIITAGNAREFFLGDDFITPHGDPLKNPIPIQFLKVLPGVQLDFYFDLKKSQRFEEITPEVKLRLFQLILEDIGIGAKTHVGYGHLEAAKKLLPKFSTAESSKQSSGIAPESDLAPTAGTPDASQATRLQDYSFRELKQAAKRGKHITGIVLHNQDKILKIQYMLDGQKAEVSIPHGGSHVFAIGSKVKLKVNHAGDPNSGLAPRFRFGGKAS